ncbi:HAD family hydrolase [Actinomycetospora lutea]|uniref:HAD family hydrolase n=1 Tax=Actinomycetospora lutea TaxID=663604 RepID=UPI002365AAB0|nr:HAD family hydrolase [Actinomycetospora lutea]MDD7936898.1 HAD family hydrolase [Actinomycetospora lutea]
MIVAATDLDRTLVHSARAAGPVVPGSVVCLERRGDVVTAMLTPRAAADLVALDRRACWVPATTRTVAEYRRLDLARGLGVAPRFAVCANGGVLLVDGEPDPAWAAEVRRRVATAAPLAEVARRLGAVRDADGCFLVARSADVELDGLAAWCAARGWRVDVDREKVHVLPVAVTKSAAVAEVRRRTGAARLLAAGDSPLDADLLAAADAGVQPVDGRLHASGWRAGHVAVTAGTGLAAGEEIAAWLRGRVT